MPKFLKSAAMLAASAAIILQGLLLHSADRPEAVPSAAPLSDIPTTLGRWTMVQEGLVDEETRELLAADDLLNRLYSNGPAGASLFIAAFRSQRNGKAPHSPKNCLPGAGWTPLKSDEYYVDTGTGSTIPVNRYVIAHGDNQSLVMYWYQSRDRAVASEYKAKFWVVVDAMQLNRTDTALVRVIVPLVNHNEDAATRQASEFIRQFYPALRTHLPA